MHFGSVSFQPRTNHQPTTHRDRQKQNFVCRLCVSSRRGPGLLKRHSLFPTGDGQSKRMDNNFCGTNRAVRLHSGAKKLLRLEHLTDEQYLASGSFGKIYTARLLSPGNTARVAIKKVRVAENGYKNALKEAEILKRVHHSNIVSIQGILSNRCEAEIWIVMEFLNAGSLRAYCTEGMRLPLTEMLKVSYDCWSALSYLHNEAKVTHKDIKPENILLHRPSDEAIVAKLCDFGLSNISDTLTQTQLTSVTGTAMYFPPEYVESIRNPEKADVYSMGASLFELFSRSYFWCQPGTNKPLPYPQIIGKLLTIWKYVKKGSHAKVQGMATFKKISCSHLTTTIRKLLPLAVRFDRTRRPTAAVMRSYFVRLLKRDAAVRNGKLHHTTVRSGTTKQRTE